MSLRRILEKVSAGELSVDEAEKALKIFALEEIGDSVKYDLGREYRRGVPEIVFGEYKDVEALKSIIFRVVERSGRVIISKIRDDQLKLVKSLDGRFDVKINERGRIVVVRKKGFKPPNTGGKVGIITAGTADIHLAEEAKTIVEEMGCKAVTIYDAGIAGFHRTVNAVKKIVEEDVDVCIVIAGMEGALPSVITSFLDIPVIGVPSSKGYGFGGRGVSALMSILQSCTLGLLAVNIDNSVGAAVAAALIANRVAKYRCRK